MMELVSLSATVRPHLGWLTASPAQASQVSVSVLSVLMVLTGLMVLTATVLMVPTVTVLMVLTVTVLMGAVLVRVMQSDSQTSWVMPSRCVTSSKRTE
jgi:hypothetical protein